MEREIIEILNRREPGPAIFAALVALLRNDSYLLECDANERSISHHFAVYLQTELPQWNIDCEYNRDGIEPKRIRYLDIHPDEEDTEARTVFPDVIAHIRGTTRNYLVIEIKKNTNSVDRRVDLAKLAGYKRELGYTHALFIELTAGGLPGVARVQWIDDDN